MAGHWYMLLLVLLVSPTMVNTISRKEEGKMRHLREEKKKERREWGRRLVDDLSVCPRRTAE